MKSKFQFYLKYISNDIFSGIVLFLVALPLCLGIAVASGAPLFSGLIAGIIGGIVVSWFSGSKLSVSGPAAGLTAIVFNAIETLGEFNGFLLSVVFAGIMQLAMGFLRAGLIAAFFPSAVIKGMLAAIGLILIMKQTPHATGYDFSFVGDESYMRETSGSSFSELIQAMHGISFGATLVSCSALLLLITWETEFFKSFSITRIIPGPLAAVLWGVGFNLWAQSHAPDWAISDKHMVTLPELGSAGNFISQLRLPDFNYFLNPKIYSIAATLAVVASLETLLSIEAIDKLDPHKPITPTNRELKAQGLGNIISGMVGGLPITAVIVRSAANINAGGQTRMSSFLHGVFLMLSVLFFAKYLNMIPLACLAAILLQTGYKLVKPKMMLDLYNRGWDQFMPFIITVIAILITDLLEGIVIGMGVGVFFVFRANFQQAITLTQHGSHYLLRLHKDVTFLNKALLRKHLVSIPQESELIIDGSKAVFIDQDVIETIAEYKISAPNYYIDVELQGLSFQNQVNQLIQKL